MARFLQIGSPSGWYVWISTHCARESDTLVLSFANFAWKSYNSFYQQGVTGGARCKVQQPKMLGLEIVIAPRSLTQTTVFVFVCGFWPALIEQDAAVSSVHLD